MAPAIHGKARCRMHGGKAGRKPIHGRYSKAAIESRREVRAILRAVRALIGE
jgi:glucans biosynthesis protein